MPADSPIPSDRSMWHAIYLSSKHDDSIWFDMISIYFYVNHLLPTSVFYDWFMGSGHPSARPQLYIFRGWQWHAAHSWAARFATMVVIGWILVWHFWWLGTGAIWAILRPCERILEILKWSMDRLKRAPLPVETWSLKLWMLKSIRPGKNFIDLILIKKNRVSQCPQPIAVWIGPTSHDASCIESSRRTPFPEHLTTPSPRGIASNILHSLQLVPGTHAEPQFLIVQWSFLSRYCITKQDFCRICKWIWKVKVKSLMKDVERPCYPLQYFCVWCSICLRLLIAVICVDAGSPFWIVLR